jgi:hypothetical protein
LTPVVTTLVVLIGGPAKKSDIFGEETTGQGEQIEIFVRGFTRDKAKQAVLAKRSNVSFFR